MKMVERVSVWMMIIAAKVHRPMKPRKRKTRECSCFACGFSWSKIREVTEDRDSWDCLWLLPGLALEFMFKWVLMLRCWAEWTSCGGWWLFMVLRLPNWSVIWLAGGTEGISYIWVRPRWFEEPLMLILLVVMMKKKQVTRETRAATAKKLAILMVNFDIQQLRE